MTMTDKDLKTAPFSFLKALALSLARDIDLGKKGLQADLEHVLSLAIDAPEMRL